MVRARPDKDWIKILFIFDLVYKRAKIFCERARGPEPFTRPRRECSACVDKSCILISMHFHNFVV
jgi:hypothetical protein